MNFAATKNQKKQKNKKRFQRIKLNMQMTCVNKTQYTGLNDKQFHFHDGIVSLPFGHFLLNKVREKKEKYKILKNTDIERDYVKMLWENCVPVQLCKFVYLKDNFTQLCQLQITFQKANDIVKNFIEQDKTNIKLLCQHLQ